AQVRLHRVHAGQVRFELLHALELPAPAPVARELLDGLEPAAARLPLQPVPDVADRVRAPALLPAVGSRPERALERLDRPVVDGVVTAMALLVVEARAQ